MSVLNKRKLEDVFILQVENITFASTEVGSVTNGRSANSTWAKDDEVIFKGKLKHILAFAVMAFDIADVAVLENFSLTPFKKWNNDGVTVIDLDPAQGEGIVTDDDMTFFGRIFNSYRADPDASYYITAELKADGSKEFFRGAPLHVFAYGMQITTAPLYMLYNFGLASQVANSGVDWNDIAGSLGPSELEKGHITLARSIIGTWNGLAVIRR